MGVMLLSSACHLTVFLFQDVMLRFVAFLAFEACVGLYFPMIGTLKGDIVPEEKRSTIYNIYRFPLNVAVLLPLLLNFSITTTFVVTTFILVNALVCQFLLMNTRELAEPAKELQKNPEGKNEGTSEEIEAM